MTPTDEEQLKQDLRIMIASEINRFQAANGFRLSIDQLTEILTKNDAHILDSLFQVAKNKGTLYDFHNAVIHTISTILSPYIPPTISN